jgi:hypothetical protein
LPTRFVSFFGDTPFAWCFSQQKGARKAAARPARWAKSGKRATLPSLAIVVEIDRARPRSTFSAFP